MTRKWLLVSENDKIQHFDLIAYPWYDGYIKIGE